ncbi:Rv2578c family radical SAM protein [Labedaea rhizosphaerae]|nr:Rv2578c family radical SAM protein [Labedaea rhizosphaerae]
MGRFDSRVEQAFDGGVRWERQRVDADRQQTLPGLPGVVRTVRTPEFAGMVFHEVRAKSVLNRVPGSSPMPFAWTVNPYRGCSHACTYCFARNSHTYLDLDSGKDFDSEIVVKVNVAEVLARQLRAPSWQHDHVAMGTNTDPYQRVEGRYQLMPGIIKALAESGTPFSILTKGPVLARDLPLLADAAQQVEVGVGVSIALLDRDLQHSVEPGTASPQARLDLVRKIREAGLPCGVMIAPVLPRLTDSTDQLDALLAAVADAGATGATVLALHLRKGAREWFLQWLERTHPSLLPVYRKLYARGATVDPQYRAWLGAKVGPLLRKYKLNYRERRESGHRWPKGSLPAKTEQAGVIDEEQLTLL